jgi:cytochrome bd-type quinol oxidase subunit 2
MLGSRWIYFASIFIVILILVITNQFFDAMKAENTIQEGALVIRIVGWIFLGLLIGATLLGSKYVPLNRTVERSKERQKAADRRLVLNMLFMVLVFLIALTVIHQVNVGAWLYANLKS